MAVVLSNILIFQKSYRTPAENRPTISIAVGSISRGRPCRRWFHPPGLGLAAAYNGLPNPDPRWLTLSAELMAFHAKLELSGATFDLMVSLRWETMGNRGYGPSINAGHGWTIWSAWARWELYRATGTFAHLSQHGDTPPVASRIRQMAYRASRQIQYQASRMTMLKCEHERHEGRMTTALPCVAQMGGQ